MSHAANRFERTEAKGRIVDPLTSTVAIGGLLVTFLSVMHAIAQTRGKRYLERSKGLADLALILKEQGHSVGPDASAETQAAHAMLVQQVGAEARANAILYLDAAGRLRKPGSYVTALFLLLYGGVMAFTALHSLIPTYGSVAQTNGAWIAKAVFLLCAVIMVTLGSRAFRRRESTRRIRARMGIVDPISVEGFVRLSEGLKRLTGRLVRQPSRP